MRPGRAQRIVAVVALVVLAAEAFLAFASMTDPTAWWNFDIRGLGDYVPGPLQGLAIVARITLLMLGTALLALAAVVATLPKP